MLYENTEKLETIKSDSLAYYIENSFAQILLDEDAQCIKEQIKSLAETGQFTIDDFCNISDQLREANFSQSTNEMLVEYMYEAFLICGSNLESVDETAMILEYSGNPEKNKQFIKTLNELEKYLNDYHDFAMENFRLGDRIVAEMKKVEKYKDKDESKVKKICDNIANMIEDQPYDQEKWNAHTRNYNEFKRLKSKFSNKFSNITMEEKKALDKKLDALISKTLDSEEICKWIKFQNKGNDTPQFDSLVKYYDMMKKINRDASVECLNKWINPYLEYQWNLLQNCIGFTNWIRRQLNIDRENRLTYKIVQKVLKK